MSWFRAISGVSIALWLGACGFTPVYAPTASTGNVNGFSSVEIANIPDSDGQYLRNVLIDKIYAKGRPANSAYTFHVSKLKSGKSGIGVGKDASVTRVQMRVNATATLVDNATGAKVLERELRSFGAYNVFAGQYATMTSADAAKKWALDDLAGQMTRELALYFDRQGKPAP